MQRLGERPGLLAADRSVPDLVVIASMNASLMPWYSAWSQSLEVDRSAVARGVEVQCLVAV